MAPELEVPCAVVTGGTDGIGKETALGLARGGYRVIVVGRDAVKGSRAARELRARSGSEKVEYLEADLSLAREADRLAGEIARRFPSLHRLVHSAGVVRGRREITEEGIESNFAVNYLARFVLTERLLPPLAAGRPGKAARVVIVGGAARGGKIHFEDVNFTRRFGTVRAVRQFCEANDVFTVELARRLAATGAGGRVTVTSLKLGVVRTNIRREFPRWMRWLVPLALDPLIGQTPSEAAASALRLLLDDDLEGVTGALFLKLRNLRRIAPGPRTSDPLQGQKLWALSEALT